MKSFEEVRRKLLEHPPGATVPLSYEEIDVLKAGTEPSQAWDIGTGWYRGRPFGLEAAPGSKLTLDAVVAAAREIRGLRVGDHFCVRCPLLPMKRYDPITLEDVKSLSSVLMDTYERFELTPYLAAQVWPGWEPENPYRTYWPE